VTSADGDVQALVRLIAKRHKATGPLLYIAGEDRAADLVGELAQRGIKAEMRIVYRAVTAPFPAALTQALRDGALDAVLHYSARSAENFVAGARNAEIEREALAVQHLCLSAQVAAPLQAAGATIIAVARHPDEAALIELLGPAAR
jgi:uroporphyrinogen-III synthase